jgi:mannose-6-phosphate isomerase-like protein (cupin superfamily)
MIVKIIPQKLLDKGRIQKPWDPLNLCTVDQSVVRIAKFLGTYHWHKHPENDELFYVLKGQIEIMFKQQPSVILYEGELIVIPKGVEHCPKSKDESYVLLFESAELDSLGDK